MNAALQTIGSGGLGQASQGAIGNLQGIGTQFQNLANQAGQGGAANDYLTGTARGDYLNGSPYLDSIISKGAGDIANQTNNMFAAGGRYGSGANQGVLSDSIAKYSNDLRNQNYQAERQNQLSAANALESAQQGRLGLQGNMLSGASGANQAASGIENQGISNVLGMISQLPTIQNNKIFDAQQQQGIGSQIDNRAQQALQDAINQWQQGDMEAWSRLGGLITAGMGSAGSYGTQTGTTTQNNGGLGALGGILSLVSLFSDRRLKVRIVPVGEENGFKVYEYSYRGQKARWRGVMAQEVAKMRPDAVVTDPDGKMRVNYAMIGVELKKVA
ncbi:tail fiber domain-containing protein [Brucella intermedia]|uniref:tail fiber domain-containing protein n=1 Tax=Brucella intermedia TaxID=94625 RepID=UPI00235F7E4C|nr:tail fiber domain-containing protein [Brucella intermedia]